MAGSADAEGIVGAGFAAPDPAGAKQRLPLPGAAVIVELVAGIIAELWSEAYGRMAYPRA
jgi:hypothetical protein